MGIALIPEWTIQNYADRHGLGELFVKQIMAIDYQYVKAVSAKQEKA